MKTKKVDDYLIAFNISKIIPSNKEKEEILNYWKENLSIADSELKFSGVLKPFYQDNIVLKSAYTEWDNKEKLWKITIFQNSCKKSLIHEFGHILLEKKLNFRSIGEHYDKTIFNYCNHLIDSFVDYELCNYQKYYKILKNLRLEDLDKIYPKDKDIIIDISYYFLYYIQLNYILKSDDKKYIKTKILKFLNIIEELIIKKDNKFTIEKLNQLKDILDHFNIIKDTKELSDHRKFIFEVINHLQLYEEKYLKKQLEMVFNTKFY